MVKDFHGIEDLVRARIAEPKRVMVIGNCFWRWMLALKKAADLKLAKPILIGSEKSIRENAEIHNADISSFDIHNVQGDVIEPAVAAMKSDGVDAIVRGDVGVLDMLSALFMRESGFRVGKRHVSGISAHFVGSLGRLLFVTDPIVTPVPDLSKKIAIVENAVKFAHNLGFSKPAVALTAAVEVIYPFMQHTVEAAVISKMNERGQIKGCIVDGPLSMDCAVIESAAKEKGVTGWVAGRADVLVQPTIETSYGMYKAFVHSVKAPSGSVVVGGKVPACITSRADSVETNYHSLLLALSQL
jgi:phosphate butyryltransferase